MNGFNVAEAGHVVNVIAPQDGNAGAPVTNQRFSMAKWDHVSIIIQFGVTGGTPTSILLKAFAAASGGSGTAIGFRSYFQDTAQGISNDVLSAGVDNAATGITTITTKDQVFCVIELDSAALPDGSPWLQLEVTLPASSNLVSAVAILSAGRNAFASSPSVTS